MTTGENDAATLSARESELATELARVTAGLRDLDHRIKNDLQLIASVFVLQARRLPPGLQRDTVRGALARLSAVSAVHRRLNPLRDRLDAEGLIRDLVGEAAAEAGREDIHIIYELEPVGILPRQAAALALITGELIRNALRYAYPEGGGDVRIGFEAADGRLRLRVEDHGVGLPDGHPTGGGFGISLVGLLAQQLRGEFEIGAAQPGVRAVVHFPQAD